MEKETVETGKDGASSNQKYKVKKPIIEKSASKEDSRQVPERRAYPRTPIN